MESNLNLASICGLFCGSCSLYINTQENNIDKLEVIAKSLNQTLEETFCDGCRAERKSAHCTRNCVFFDCAKERNISFCGECNDYPCQELKNFQTKMPHRLELWSSHERIKEVGWEIWMKEMMEHYKCTSCETINSAYNVSCRKCGFTPGNNFVLAHKESILRFISSK